MPTIAVFYGITIRLYYEDHAPPHVHAIYGGDEALVAIEPPRLIQGRLPRRATALVLEWVTVRQEALMRAWADAQRGVNPGRVAPLE